MQIVEVDPLNAQMRQAFLPVMGNRRRRQPGRAHAPGAVIQEGMRALGGDLDASVLSAAL